jgi:cyclophilin family peptidyl-prolyl cis-trans isomerase
MPLRIITLFILLAFTCTAWTFAQDDDAPAAGKEKSATAGAATQKFNTLLDDWKGILKDLRKLKSTFATAKPEEAKDLEKQWHDLIDRGNKLLPELRQAGQEAYGEGASVDPQLQRFLLKLAQDAIETDDFEVAFDLATTMLKRAEQEKAPAPKELYNVAGIAAFMINDYDAAEKYHQMAVDAGTWNESKLGIPIASKLKDYRKYWEKERAAREEDAKKDDLPRVKISTTAGDMVVELFEDQAPDTVGNFISLIESDFYNGLAFHRVLPHFMAQGGDPKGDGTGGPGYQIYDEVDKPDHRRHFRGSLSMAKSQFKDTGGSQFFICFTPREHLDGVHTVFGRVIEGMDVLAKIQRVDPENPKGVEKTKITSIEVLRKRDHQYLPRKVE